MMGGSFSGTRVHPAFSQLAPYVAPHVMMQALMMEQQARREPPPRYATLEETSEATEPTLEATHSTVTDSTFTTTSGSNEQANGLARPEASASSMNVTATTRRLRSAPSGERIEQANASAAAARPGPIPETELDR